MPSNFEFEVIILSYNRPELLRECLESWLTQDLKGTRLFVSDNSTNDQVAQMMAQRFPQIELRKIRPPLSAEAHFNLCRERAIGDWYMLFHDDDLMLPGQWKRLKEATLHSPPVVAVAGNALVLDDQNLTDRLFNSKLKLDRVLTKPSEMAQGYCFPVSSHQPFPAYLYRRLVVQALPFDNREARKYSDTSFLLRVIREGPVLWLARPALAYRIHPQSDTSSHDFRAGMMLARQFVAAGFLSSSLEVRSFRAWQCLLRLRQFKREKLFEAHPWQTKILLNVVARHYLLHPFQIVTKAFQMITTKITRLKRAKAHPASGQVR